MENQRESHFYRVSVTDWAVIGIVLVFAAFCAAGIVLKHRAQDSGEKQFYVFLQNHQIMQIDARQEGIFPVLDGRMKIEIRQGRVRVVVSDCPQHICMHTGWISQVGQTLVCVPNKLIVEIKASGHPLLDAVAF